MAECWNLPGPAGFTVVREAHGVYMVGENGKRPMTFNEQMRWLAWKEVCMNQPWKVPDGH